MPSKDLYGYFYEIMITQNKNPVEWAQLNYELKDAHEHLGSLIKEMESSGCIDIEKYSVDLAHVFAHLNRAWNSREFVGEMTDSEWKKFQSFPNDLEPLA